MGYSIFGEILERGHCEVHPEINEEYPCHLCVGEDHYRYNQDDALRISHEREYEEYCMGQLWEAWMDVMKHGYLQQGLMS